MKTHVIVFPGSNCDRDVAVAIKNISGQQPQMVWHKETSIEKSDLIVVPGGFSYGDYLRSGAIAGKSLIIAFLSCWFAVNNFTPIIFNLENVFGSIPTFSL